MGRHISMLSENPLIKITDGTRTGWWWCEMDQNVFKEPGAFQFQLQNDAFLVGHVGWWVLHLIETEVVIKEMVLGNERLSSTDTWNVNWSSLCFLLLGFFW